MNRTILVTVVFSLIVALGLGVWSLDISAWLKVPIVLVAFALPLLPLFRLILSQIGATEVSKELVQSHMKLHQWYTIPELAKIMRQALGHKVSHHNLMAHIYAMKEEGKAEGRERQPPEQAYFLEGNIWEYRRVL